MQVSQKIIRKGQDPTAALAAQPVSDAQLLLVFGAVDYFAAPDFARRLRAAYPDAILLGCSTAGEITGDGVDDGSCTLSALRFERTALRCATTELADLDDSPAAGERLGRQLAAPDLRAVLLFAPGVDINGSALLHGLERQLARPVPITGGLAGDGGAFRQTFTLAPSGVGQRTAVAVGLYGEHLRFGHGSFGGWEAFGPPRQVTRCAGNRLYELDGEPALEVYKRYLGEHAQGLPASGLLFPFAMLGEDHSSSGLIRTILAVDEATGSLTLAGEIAANGYLKLMHASTEKLVDGAVAAARQALGQPSGDGERLAILVSCVGRKLVMGDRVDEEVEAVADILAGATVLTGFYSYGEICPFEQGASCQLHNQTMTITCLGED